MSMRALLLLAGTLSAAFGADDTWSALLMRVRARVLQSTRTAPRYVCSQEIERRDFELTREKTPLPYENPARMCELIELEEPGKSARLKLTTSDRAHLDVMLTAGSELFSWPGERSFDAKTPGDLLGGGFSGNGDFAGFLIGVFAPRHAGFQFVENCGVNCVRFSYEIAPEDSRYTVKTEADRATVGFHGTFDVDTVSGSLIQLSVIATDLQKWLAPVCETRTRMTYAVKSEAGAFLTPQSSESEFVSSDGSYSVNRVEYIGCRRYTVESAVSFTDRAGKSDPAAKAAPVAPASGSELRLRLVSKIDSETSFAGDTLEAALDRPALDTQHGVIPAGTVVRGHLAQVKKTYGSRPQVSFAIRFDTIVLGGAPVPITLSANGKMDDHGRAVFRFNGANIALDNQFVSSWRVK
jgi:hypothetical protein